MPFTKAGFPDLLDPRFREITYRQFEEQRDMVPFLYTQEKSSQYVERGSNIIGMGDLAEFDGDIAYDGPEQGYDWTATHKEFAAGIEIERLLWEFDKFGVVDDMFGELADAAHRTRQKHAFRVFNQSFIDDEYFFNTTEAVSLVNDSHTSPLSVPTTGYDNRGTTAFSPTALGSAITEFRKFRTLNGERINVVPDTLIVPVDLRDRAIETVKTIKGLNATDGVEVGVINVYNSEYDFKIIDSPYLTDANDWWLVDSKFMKKNLKWYDAVPVEFARVEDFDGVMAKYRAYGAWTQSHGVWQWIYGSEVS